MKFALTKKCCLYIYIYIYIFWQHYFFVDSFILPYWFYNIRQELVDVSSIIIYFPSSFCPTLGHHQGRIYYKSDVTFVCTLLLCKKKSVCTIAVCSVYSSLSLSLSIYIYIYIYKIWNWITIKGWYDIKPNNLT